MRNRLRILLLLGLAPVLMVVGNLSANPKPKGLVCGTPDDPIPCSSFNNGTCSYVLDSAANCCDPTTPSFQCPGICC